MIMKKSKILYFLLTLIFVTCLCSCTSNKKIKINSFGANNIPSSINEIGEISSLQTPIRNDGSEFEGWYYSLNFDEQYKVNSHDSGRSDCIFAKYDNCYCFSLRHGTLGCFGVKDPNYTEDVWIDYFIPAGEYSVTFSDYSTAKIGSIMILSNNDYTVKDGYQYIKQFDYKKHGERQTITLLEDQHIFITVNSVFVFQRNDVEKNYVEYSMSDDSFDFIQVFLISFAILLPICFVATILIRKKSKNKTNISNEKEELIIFIPDNLADDNKKSQIGRFYSVVNDIYEPIEAALILESGFINSVFITEKYIGVQTEGLSGIKIQEKPLNDFERFEFSFINLFIVFADGTRFKLGTCNKTTNNELIIKKFTKIIRSINNGTKNKKIRFKIGNKILCFDEDNKEIEYDNIHINYGSVRDAQIIVIDEGYTHSANIAGSLVGNILAGGVGSLIGATIGDKSYKSINSVVVSILTFDKFNPNIDIVISDKSVSVSSETYSKIDKVSRNIMSILGIIIDENRNN